MLTIRELLVDHQTAPAALAVPRPALNWKLQSDRTNVYQEAYRLVLREGGETVWDSGRVKSAESVAVRYDGPPLREETSCTLALTVWDNQGGQADAEISFRTARFTPQGLTGRWVTHGLTENNSECPVFVRRFSAGPAVRASLCLSACGIYTATLNGQPVSADWFAPGWTEYGSRIQYQTYDVTPLIRPQNTLEVTVANGWYAGYLNGTRQIYGQKTALFAELCLLYADGRRETVATDDRWQWYLGESRAAEFYHGETIDRTAAPAAPQPVAVLEKDLRCLVPQQSEPVRVAQTLAPAALLHAPDGTPILDFGQNLAGVVELTADGAPGQRITLRFAEALDRDGTLYTANLRTARATDVFVCRGGRETFCPRFTFHGFRYVSVDGMGAEPPLTAFRALALSSALRPAAEFSCSHPLVNRLWSNIQWSQRCNFIDVPTDCPQRDERLG